ncbi:MAG: hypothetical protein RJA70_4767 [Pseudomonadota bacterium]|jgi:tellurite resistance protein
MTPSEKNVVKSLVAVAWADGKIVDGEYGVIEGLLCGFDASEEEEREILEFARARRSLQSDIPVAELSQDDRELLLTNAALLTLADGERSESERAVLSSLVTLLGFDVADAAKLIAQAGDGTLVWSSRSLEDV